ncbi:chromate transporter [Salinicola corii]|uniref:Chromate transporter n=1 Tax=Salinicola corii TaxID=2606937 RepID=A0A640W9S4_9GAMM|nr:chromate transporter [Salinicola corii]KAA0015854.1 chromate transporter [Salinicola corii]
MIYWDLFLAFFIPNIVGYGGGPAIIPLVENEVVGRYGWMSSQQFAETLALGNTLPSPIATKMAGYIGYDIAGIGGSLVATFATVAPSLILMLVALGTLYRYRDSIKVKSMSQWVRPVIMVLMGYLTWSFLGEGVHDAGWIHTAIIAAISVVMLWRLKLHPVWAVVVGLVYGGFLLG